MYKTLSVVMFISLLMNGCTATQSDISRSIIENSVGPITLPGMLMNSGRHSRVTSPTHVNGRTFEYDTDRMGSDFTNLILNIPDPMLCQQACDNNNKCIAWTYVKPNTIQGPNPICWLKDSVPQAMRNINCISGTK